MALDRIKGLRANQRAKHEMEECERRRLKCANGCGKSIQARSMHTHLKDSCTRRFVICVNGCGKPVRFNEMRDHIDNHCGKRVVSPLSRCASSNTPSYCTVMSPFNLLQLLKALQ